jgi:small membrane protein
MTLFQCLSLTALGLLFVREVVGFWRDPAGRTGCWVRGLVWSAAAVAIACPGLVQGIADALGIGRGTDLVVYFFGLVFLGVSFYFYSRFVRVQRQITQLVRYLAIQEARQGRLAGEDD